MKIRTEIFLAPFYDCDDRPDSSVCNAAHEGIIAVETGRAKAGLDSAFAGLFTTEFDPAGAIEKQLGISKQPTLIFFDESGNVALARLVKSQISKTRVETIYRFLSSLEAEENGNGGYVTADGESVSQKELWEKTEGSWFGLGLGIAFGGCPKWMPKAVCELPLYLAALFLILMIFLIIKVVK